MGLYNIWIGTFFIIVCTTIVFFILTLLLLYGVVGEHVGFCIFFCFMFNIPTGMTLILMTANDIISCIGSILIMNQIPSILIVRYLDDRNILTYNQAVYVFIISCGFFWVGIYLTFRSKYAMISGFQYRDSHVWIGWFLIIFVELLGFALCPTLLFFGFKNEDFYTCLFYFIFMLFFCGVRLTGSIIKFKDENDNGFQHFIKVLGHCFICISLSGTVILVHINNHCVDMRYQLMIAIPTLSNFIFGFYLLKQ